MTLYDLSSQLSALRTELHTLKVTRGMRAAIDDVARILVTAGESGDREKAQAILALAALCDLAAGTKTGSKHRLREMAQLARHLGAGKGLAAAALPQFEESYAAMLEANGQSWEGHARRMMTNSHPRPHDDVCQRVADLRLAGRLEEAALLIDSSARNRASEWQQLLIEAQAGRPSALVAAVRRGGSHRRPAEVLHAKLWLLALGDPRFQNGLPRVETLRRALTRDVATGATDWLTLDMVAALQAAHDPEVPRTRQFLGVAAALDRSARLGDGERRLLALAAAARWLASTPYHELTGRCLGEYRALSLSLGGVADGLGMTKNLKVVDHWSRTTAKVIQAVPASWLQRSAVLGKTASQLAGIKVKDSIKRLTAKPGEVAAIDAETRRQMGKALAQGLGRIKGPAMKLGQFASIASHLLDEDVRAELAALQDSAPALASDVILQVVEREFGVPWRETFRDWDETPIGTGSISQVHRARLLDGREVAVKVQFPNIKQVVRSSLRVLKPLRLFLKALAPGANIDEAMSGVPEAFLKQCDFVREADFQTRYREELAGEDVLVPRVIAECSGQTVLTMELIDGVPLTEFQKSAPQEEINRIAKQIFRTTQRMFFRAGLSACDPHPGNYLISSGRVAFLDFGACHSWTPEFVGRWRRALLNMMGDPSQWDEKLISNLGVVGDAAAFDVRRQIELTRRSILKPCLENKTFRYTPEFLREWSKEILADNPNFHATRVPSELAMMVTVFPALDALMALLHAEANWHEIMMEILNEKPDSLRLAG